MARIYKDKTKIDNNKIFDFFEDRGKRAKSQEINNINAVLYQDDNPQLAKDRDEHEKSLITPLLKVDSHSRILDVACGIGRWADILLDDAAYYCGVDFSESLIEIAESRFTNNKNADFRVLACQNLSLKALDTSSKFNVAISAGLLIYLNDEDIHQYFSGLVECLDNNARLYIREPIATQTRLTLSDHYSDELKHDYHVIYRTEDEMNEFFSLITKKGFKLTQTDWLYDDEELNNRQETRQKYWIFSR